MNNPVVALAVTDGYWGQVFEYWPFTLLLTVTIVYAIVTFSSDIISRRRWKPPAGAVPRMEFIIDPAVIARARFRTGLYLIRFGGTVVLAATALFCYLSYYPLAIGTNYGLSQDINTATTTGTTISLVAASLAFIAAIYVRKSPLALLGFIVVAMAVVVFAPFIANGQARWLGIMAAATALPLGMVTIGMTIAFKNYGGTRRASSPSAATSAPPPVSVS